MIIFGILSCAIAIGVAIRQGKNKDSFTRRTVRSVISPGTLQRILVHLLRFVRHSLGLVDDASNTDHFLLLTKQW